MNRCYLSLGSNQKGPERQLRLAVKAIKTIPYTSVCKVSSLYWNPAWGLHTQQDFCNAVVEIRTFLSPLFLLKWCKKIEARHGRVRQKRWGPRILDLDILLYENRTIQTKGITIPHPLMLSRDFVLVPLLEINPTILYKPRAC